jgi:hypothetical protein
VAEPKRTEKTERTQREEDPFAFGQTDGDVDIITLGCNESEWLRRYGAGNQMRGDFDVFVMRGYFKNANKTRTDLITIDAF